MFFWSTLRSRSASYPYHACMEACVELVEQSWWWSGPDGRVPQIQSRYGVQCTGWMVYHALSPRARLQAPKYQ
jgi:hypothetical protein